ncbi:MAG: CoA activase, partial [Desulfobacterales bacterium]|nr:CoA activase [Desulfobacterales bacterium]
MAAKVTVLGIDVGSVSVSAVLVDEEKRVSGAAYDCHGGDVRGCLKSALEEFDLESVSGVAATSSTPGLVKADGRFDNQVAVISAHRRLSRGAGALLMVGAEKFGLTRFDQQGHYLNFKSNTSCAAGTGSFLDQQAGRLGMSGAAELSRLALENTGEIPKIASRCAVFAKTDLAHAQQEGYQLGEICDGLCLGLARNIVDTLFSGAPVRGPVAFAGGVSRNRAVVRHIRRLIGLEMTVDKRSHLFGAMGAAFMLLEEGPIRKPGAVRSPKEILAPAPAKKEQQREPLELTLSTYPDFAGLESYLFPQADPDFPYAVEVDVYYDAATARPPEEAYIGVDIGSTSTKAVLLDARGSVLAGFYTRTAGRPVRAMQQVFASIHDLLRKKGAHIRVLGAGTTGSGRVFAGKIMGADLIVDEITAHARAAAARDPDVDTIIEIGGQDSKFTTLKNGRVTFSIMNTVCAAGTGSFIEEQAGKLGCPLSDFSARTRDKRAPVTSDRCTVFMERDINHYLSLGFDVDEMLASTLYSVRDNYLSKVAIENSIGDVIFFQGATAKNRALVAAFEQRLGKPIHVSPYCHLTGALGAALMLRDQGARESGFKGLDLYKRKIHIQSEVCDLCANHCKLTVADVDDEKAAYGFLCGRDYDTRKFVNNNRSGFDLLRARRKAAALAPPADGQKEKKPPGLVMGIPAALHLYEDLPFWKKFFQALSIRVVTSEGSPKALKRGKKAAGAEFCAPMAALHGHVDHLLDRMDAPRAPGESPDRPDYIFLPFYFDRKPRKKGLRRQYCYYSQFAPSLAAALDRRRGRASDESRILTPLVYYLYGDLLIKRELHRVLNSAGGGRLGFREISAAWDRARAFRRKCMARYRELYRVNAASGDDIHVVLLGRPYTILSPSMNKKIPDIFASLGVKTFFQDMLPPGGSEASAIEPLLDEFHWGYAAKILEAAETTARTPGAYPALVTSFKCSPDSFIMEYFKKLMESHNKPYLILQLDEHDSSVGYATRVEAAIRSFRNHHSEKAKRAAARYAPSLFPARTRRLSGKTILFPNWDNLSLRLIVASMRKEGFDARLLEETETSIRESLRTNSGQCIPISIMAREFIDYVKKHDLDPGNTVCWFLQSNLCCNLGLIPHHLKTLLTAHGRGFEKSGVYTGSISLLDISTKLPASVYFSYMFGGLVRKMGCKVRPYETAAGSADAVIERSMEILEEAFGLGRSREEAVKKAVALFKGVKTSNPGPSPRPLVAIFGDLYARDNEVINQELLHFIEANGGEALTTPYSYLGRMVARPYLRKWLIEG